MVERLARALAEVALASLAAVTALGALALCCQLVGCMRSGLGA